MKVLIVDDDVKICDILKRYLDRTEFEAVIANCGVDAEGKLKQEQYALVVFDVMLPDADGFDLLSNLRNGYYFNNPTSSDKDTPAIMLTALGQTKPCYQGLKGRC